jgi:3-phenylpropionate/cinnamic acid dioxygenase small subunit
MQPPPTDPIEQLQWLVHRAAITDLQSEYARCLDDKDFITWQSLFTDDAELHMPYESIKKPDLPAAAHQELDYYPGT